METLLKDIRYAMRNLWKHPGFTTIAVLTLALGIGANTAIFSVVKSVLLRPLPYAQADRLVQFRFYFPAINHEQTWVAPRDVVEWQAQSQSFERTGIYRSAVLDFTDNGLPEAVYGIRVSADVLPTLGVAPALGRYFSADEDQPGRNHVIVLSDDVWRRHFNADQYVIGKSVRLSQENYTVIGVMPVGFNFPLNLPITAKLPSRQMGFWYPLGIDLNKLSRADAGYGAIALLRPGIGIAQAQAEINQIAARQAVDYPQTNAGREVRLVSLTDQVVGGVRPLLLILTGAVALVCLIVCANIANLLLVRADGRRREMAIRQSLGASRWRLVRQALTESLLLALFGGAAGALLAQWALPLLLRLSPQAIPRLNGTKVDSGVLAFTLALSFVAGLLFGLVPAWRTATVSLTEDLKQTPGNARRKRRVTGNALIVVEVALALILTVCAGLLLNSFVRLIRIDPGFSSEHVLASVLLPNPRYRDPQAKMEFYRRVIERVGSLPGVESVAASDSLPFSGQNAGDQIRIEGRTPLTTIDLSTQSEVSVVTADFAKTMGIPLLSGRFFSERDSADSTPVVVISEKAAQQYWPGENPLGKRLAFGISNDHMVWREVIGIVKGIANAGLDQPQRPHVYAPVRQLTFPANFLLVRSTLPPKEMAKTVREAVAAVDPEQSVFLSATLEDWISDSLAERRFALLLLGLFGALALALACLGVFGVVSHAVAKRTQEIGVRMALGARPRDVLRLVLTQGMRPALLGVAIGVFGALALTRLMKSLLFGVTATDPLTYFLVATFLSWAALLACYLPARWATKVDPLVALRYE